MKSVNIPNDITEDVSYLAAIISGDGTMTKYFIKISDRKKENIRFLENLIKNTFRVNSSMRQESENKWILEVDSKELVDYFNKKFQIPIGKKSENIKVPEIIKLSSEEIRKAYIQGWLDAEGYPENWNKPNTDKIFVRIRFGCKSKDVTDWINNEIRKMEIKVSNIWYNSKTFRFQIAEKNSVINFARYVGFRYPTKRVF